MDRGHTALSTHVTPRQGGAAPSPTPDALWSSFNSNLINKPIVDLAEACAEGWWWGVQVGEMALDSLLGEAKWGDLHIYEIIFILPKSLCTKECHIIF